MRGSSHFNVVLCVICHLPSWLTTSGNVMLRRYVRHTKNDPLVDEVELTDVNPTYAHIRYSDGRESTVSLKDLSPCPSP